jgi:hypothetical protein
MVAEPIDQLEKEIALGNLTSPSKIHREVDEGVQLIKVLTDHENFLNIVRAEMKGEQLYQDEKGDKIWVQVEKPMFIKLDKLNKPLKVKNNRTGKEEYVLCDEAVNDVISILKSCGLNPIAPLTNINEEEIRADLLELESKIAVLLCVNRKKWGLAKSEYPMAVGKLKVLIKDARYRAKDGTVLKALRTITSRIERTSEPSKKKEEMFN